MSSKKYKLSALVASVCWLGLQGNVALAADQTMRDDQLVNKLAKRTQALESQIQYLQGQVATLKKKRPQKMAAQRSFSGVKVVSDPKHPVFILGTPVINSPYIGIISEYNASDLVVNQPYVNEDLYLLQQRKQIWNYLHKNNNYPIANTPIIDVSGKIEAQVVHADDFGGSFQHGSANDIDLTGVELDTEILVNKWITGLIAFVYDNSPPSTSTRRIDNSNVLLERGFLTIGNLAEFPIYGSIGQFYMPFGQYSSAMISDPFTKTLGRTKARAISLGFSKQFNSENNLNLAAFIFRGPTRTSIENNGLHNYGANIDYTFTKPKWSLDLAGSYIRNIADSLGMQHNGNSRDNNFAGFATHNETEVLNPVGGLDGRGTLAVGPVSLTAEYVTATSSFLVPVLSFNHQGAKPQTFHTEVAYTFNALDKPSAIIIGYDQSKDALALLIPKKRYAATASTSIWKNTIESIEFRHDIDYNTTDVATGGTGFNEIIGTGNSGNTVTFQIGLYF